MGNWRRKVRSYRNPVAMDRDSGRCHPQLVLLWHGGCGRSRGPICWQPFPVVGDLVQRFWGWTSSTRVPKFRLNTSEYFQHARHCRFRCRHRRVYIEWRLRNEPKFQLKRVDRCQCVIEQHSGQSNRCEIVSVAIYEPDQLILDAFLRWDCVASPYWLSRFDCTAFCPSTASQTICVRSPRFLH